MFSRKSFIVNLAILNNFIIFLVWNDRFKQISKKWKALSQDQKNPILAMARENRTKLSRGRKAHQVCISILLVWNFSLQKLTTNVIFNEHGLFGLRFMMIQFLVFHFISFCSPLEKESYKLGLIGNLDLFKFWDKRTWIFFS